MGDEPYQVLAIDRRVAEALSFTVPVRIKAAAADLHDRAGPALSRQGIGTDLPGDGGRMIQRGVEGVGDDMQPGVGGTGIGRAQRVELFDGTIGLYYDERAWQESKPFYPTGLAEHELDQLSEQADPRFLAGAEYQRSKTLISQSA